MKYNCLIIDDEEPARRLIENYCGRINDLEVLGSFKSPIDALEVINSAKVDLLFLDIQMPDISGVDFLKSIKLSGVQVIFTTAYREYAIDGFNLKAIDYLLKPIAFNRFLQAVQRFYELASPVKTFEQTSKENTFIIIRSNKRDYKLNHQDILYVKSENEYVRFFTKSQGKLMVFGALKDVIEGFISNKDFLRVHRSYIVNLQHIDYLEGNQIVISGEHIPIGNRYKADFLQIWK